MIRAVLWDLDGTLLDFRAAESAALRKTYAAFGFGECRPETVALYSAINVRHWEMLERGEMTREEILVRRFEEFFSAVGLDPAPAAEFSRAYEHSLPETIRFMPGALETVAAMRGRVTQCVVTNGSASVQWPKLRRSGLDALVDRIFISEEIGAEKPSRAFFDRVLSVLSLPPEECLVVGDSLTSDIRGGILAGMRTCWYNPAGAENSGFSVPDRETDRLEQISELIECL